MWLESLEVHHLWFTCTARTTIHLGPQAGAQLRGALWEALQTTISDTDLLERAMSLETPGGVRGSNPARPFAIRPPMGDDPGADRVYTPSTTFSFGISLFGEMAALFPYVVQAVDQMGQLGVGYGRGQFYLDAVEARNPLTEASQALMAERRVIALPSIPVTAEQVAANTQSRSQEQVRLCFITPTQLTGANKRLLSKPEFDRLVARLVERAQMMAENYTSISTPREQWRNLHLQLAETAQQVEMADCDTRWVRVRSGSRRSNQGKKISGFVGEVTYCGALTPFLPWLIWGQSLQVGKNTVKGDGWYTLV
jgi:hypothetical protein